MKDISLVNFNMLMNYDYAVLKTMIEKYDNDNILRKLIKISNLKEMYRILIMREEVNPLYIILKSEFIESVDDLLDELFAKDYKSILDNIILNTKIYSLVNNCNKSDNIDINICCENVNEELIIKNLFNYRTILRENVNYNDYSSFMVHYKEDIISNPSIYYGKSVFMANTRYNLKVVENQLVLSPDLIMTILDKINLKLIQIL